MPIFPSKAFSATIGILIAMALPASGFARERGPRVEVACPSPPIPVSIGKQQVLVYELHVTNFDAVPLNLKRIDVFANEASGSPLSTLSEAHLAGAMARVGAGIGGTDRSKDTRRIEPGARAIVFLWIELPADRTVPTSLRHKMIFSVADDPGNSDATLEDFAVPVGQGSVPTLAPPFKEGTWLAADGPANDSPHRKAITAIDGHIYSAERFAIDWIKVGPNGDSHHDGTSRNENWWGFGEPVLAVADGEVTEVVDGIEDNPPRQSPPATLDNIAGNHVILQISPTRFVTYAHLQNGSIKVKPRDKVRRGVVLALLGNSGQTTGAHLHFQVTDRNSVLQSQGVPFVFSHFTYLGPGSDYEIDKHVAVPWTNSIPSGNAVVEFSPADK